MREILFRGKRVDNGELIESNSIQQLYGGSKVYLWYQGEWIEVISETVGEYTGLSDKKGKKIFEGDICGCFCNTQLLVVEYCKDRCGYFFDDCVSSGGCEPQPECLGNLSGTIEVLGNIHDNPELLEE